MTACCSISLQINGRSMSSAHCAITATGGGSTLSAATFRVFRRRAWFNVCGAWKRDRKSTRLNSSHQIISYAVFCLKKKKNGNSHADRILVTFLKRTELYT